jgi:agmatinase
MTETISFDPNALALKDSNIFGLPFTPETAKLVFIPVPWEVTVSYNAGTADGPSAIFDASKQVDLYDPDAPDAWKSGYAMAEIPPGLSARNEKFRDLAEDYIEFLEDGGDVSQNHKMKETLAKIDAACEDMNKWVQEQAASLLDSGKMVALIGGDHSTPLGLMRELAKRYESFGILHFDAHLDLRDAFEGFKYSHASIMFNATNELPSLKKLVQIGIRDYCEQEVSVVRDSNGRIVAYYDRALKERIFEGETWKQLADEMIQHLPHHVYVSFDIDGLDPKLCPNTGTPVAGGLEVDQALYVVKQMVRSGRKIIGFDLNEVAPGEDEWDANVAARLLYRLANLTMQSQQT